MSSRILFVCRNTCKKNTAWCNLLTVIGWILFVVICVLAAYFTFVGLGQIVRLITGHFCNYNYTRTSACGYFMSSKDSPFFVGFLIGLQVIACSALTGGLIFGIGYCFRHIFKKPFGELKDNWIKSANPDYETFSESDEGFKIKSDINLVVNTEATNLV